MSITQHARKAMNEVSTKTADATATPANKQAKKRPRMTPADKLKQLQEKQEKLEARIKNEKAKLRGIDRKKDTRRKIVAGAIALEHMEHDENFKGVMDGLLKRHLKDADKELFDL